MSLWSKSAPICQSLAPFNWPGSDGKWPNVLFSPLWSNAVPAPPGGRLAVTLVVPPCVLALGKAGFKSHQDVLKCCWDSTQGARWIPSKPQLLIGGRGWLHVIGGSEYMPQGFFFYYFKLLCLCVYLRDGEKHRINLCEFKLYSLA